MELPSTSLCLRMEGTATIPTEKTEEPRHRRGCPPCCLSVCLLAGHPLLSLSSRVGVLSPCQGPGPAGYAQSTMACVHTHTHTHTTTSRLTHLQLVHEFRALWSCLPASLCPRHGGLRKWDCPSLMHTISSQREGKHLAHGLALVGRNELHQGDWEKIGTCC